MRIRTLPMYQPFCSLMLHGKKETRWVRVGKKPPFPLGKYVLYSTKKEASNVNLFEWCGPELMASITDTLLDDGTQYLNGFALAIGVLTKIRPMTKEDETLGFVQFKGIVDCLDPKGKKYQKHQWVLEFENVVPIEPALEWLWGKQGVGFVPEGIEFNVANQPSFPQ